jgi:hypothetical protein
MARYRQVSVLVAMVLVLLGVASGPVSATHVPGPAPILLKARAQVSAPVGGGFFVHVWTAPTRTGGICHFNTIDHQLTAQRPSSWPPNGGGGCSETTPEMIPHRRAFRYISISIAVKTGKHSVPTNIEGELVTSASPARLVAKWAGGAHELTLHNHYFAGGSPAMFGQVPSLNLVAYDRHNRVIASWQNSP